VFCPNPKCAHARDTGKPAEYREGITTCPECGAKLVPKRPIVSAHGESPLAVVASFTSRQDADLAVSMLAANGIQARTFADDCGGMDPGLGFATHVRVLVPQTQAKDALALLRDPEERSQSDDV
jgi:hypothetical protein